jgi:SulP family sulfate permease
MIIAAFLFMRNMTESADISLVSGDYEREQQSNIGNLVIPKDVDVFEITGPLFFGAANKFKDRMSQFGMKKRIIILRMRSVSTIDSTGINYLNSLATDLSKQNTILILSGVSHHLFVILNRTGLVELIGTDNILTNIFDALDRARELLGIEKLGRPEGYQDKNINRGIY